ncbi:MAG: hypothetical protein IPK98_13740 [Chloracidobacterium sp.]|nr:hypothetical protein [Chloracidobacterium sp.]
MIDEFGGLEKAISIAKELANLPADKDVRRVVFPAPRPFFETLFNDETSSEAKAQEVVIKSLPSDIRRSFRYMAMFDQMQQGRGMMMMPFELTIK